MTKICAVITNIADIASARASGAEALEFRLDLFPDITGGLSFLKQDIPTIVTLRSAADEPRRELFARALAAGADYVDIESDSCLRDAFPGRTICSYHDFNATPDADGILHICADLSRSGIPKAAFMVHSVSGLMAIAAAASRLKETGRPFILIGMGAAGRLTRIRAPVLGSWLTYCAVTPQQASAPGQLTVAEARAAGSDPVVTGLIGWPLTATRSPAIHNAAYHAAGIRGVYTAIPTSETDLPLIPALMNAYDITGLNVTIPHKQAVMPYLTARSSAADAIGAVNTITRGLTGENTDWQGIAAALDRFPVAGKKMLILGAGGAARAAAYYGKVRGARLFIANRTAEHASRLADEFGGSAVLPASVRPEYDIVLNASPVAPVAPEQAAGDGVIIMDMVYPGSSFLAACKKAGAAVTLSGKTMLIHQAAASFELWTGTGADIAAMETAFGDET